jgi:phage gp16-like protein
MSGCDCYNDTPMPGGSPTWQLFHVAYRASKQLLDGLALLSGYHWAAIRRIKRPVTRDLIRFHREEQMKKLRAILRVLLTLRKVDSFTSI